MSHGFYPPESGTWTCTSCNVPLIEKAAEIHYLESSFHVTLMTCPECGLVLVPEHLAMGKMLEVEKILEDK